MTATLERPAVVLPQSRPSEGGMPARRAMVRWAWRLFRREWRQQLLVLILVVVAVAAVVIGSAVATNTPLPTTDGFGTAMDQATFHGAGPHLSTQIAQIHQRYGAIDVIENEPMVIPGSVSTYNLRSQDPHGTYGQPMLTLLSGRYPRTGSQVAVTQGVASAFSLRVGQEWRQGGVTRQVVGIVENPQSLLDEFALVLPGQVTNAQTVSVLFDAPGVPLSALGSNVQTPASVATSNSFNPSTITLALATIGMLLIALVSVGGFTVLAQRRLRSLGMLGSLGATDRNIRLVVWANGLVVGLVGTLLGFLLGMAGWFVYRPRLEQSSHHLFGVFALPWGVIAIIMALAVIATFFAASRPAKSITKVPIVTALAGRPASPREVHRSAIPGVLVMVIGFLLLSVAGSQHHGGGAPELVFGLVALVVGTILLSPMFLTVLARAGRRTPIAIRLALRDLARYRARSGSALSAISIGILIAVIVCVVAAARYGNVLDYAGPNLANNQMVVYAPTDNNGNTLPLTAAVRQQVDQIATSMGARSNVELDQTSASLNHTASGRNFNGQIFVATPQLLRAFGISASQIEPHALILTMRPGLSGLSGMQFLYGSGGGKSGNVIQNIGPGSVSPNTQQVFPCPAGSCVANPLIQTVSQLPGGTSAPNTVVTEYAVQRYDLGGSQISPVGWLLQTNGPISASEITSARLAAASENLSIETKNDAPSSSQITNWATVFGIALALGILAMSVGLIRSEAGGDLRTLTATGASAFTRRTLTAATAGALAFLGALLGVIGGYVAALGFFSSNSLDGLSSLSSIPYGNLAIILFGMPAVAVLVGFVIAGRQPSSLNLQPTE